MALDRLTLLDETIINNTATSVATTVVNNSAQTNYISYPVAVGNPISNGWRRYKDTDTVAPTVGAGGSPNTDLIQNTSSPLNSTGDFRIVKTSGASRRGEGISTDFTIANRHLAKVLQISFDYEVPTGSTLANGDLRVYIIANPGVTNVVIEPVNVSIQGVLTGTRVRHLATFQTDFTITTYRLCIHIATETNSNQNIDFNNFRVWETTQSIGSIITDWQEYTPSFNTNVSFKSGRWRRVGSFAEVHVALTLNGAFVGINESNILPPGIIIDSDKLPLFRASFWFLGNGSWSDSGVGDTSQYVCLQITNRNIVFFGGGQGAGSADSLTFQIRFPVVGWGSSVAMSSDVGDSRVVSGQYNTLSSTGSMTGGVTTLKYSTIVKDTHASYTTSTGVLTIPVAGDYYFKFGELYQNTTDTRLRAYVNGSPSVLMGIVRNANYDNPANLIPNLRAGDLVEFRFTDNVTTTLTGGANFSWFRISAGSQVIASSETVGARYTTDTAQNNDIIKCEDRDFDTHNAYSITTGKYTVPMSGVYRISGQITSNNAYQYTDIRKNNDVIICRDLILLSSANYVTTSPNLVTRLIAGDTVWLWSYTGGTMTVDTGYRNMFCIERIGI